MKQKKQPGRKRLFSEPRRFGGVCDAAELAAWQRAAGVQPLSAWLRAAANEKREREISNGT